MNNWWLTEDRGGLIDCTHVMCIPTVNAYKMDCARLETQLKAAKSVNEELMNENEELKKKISEGPTMACGRLKKRMKSMISESERLLKKMPETSDGLVR